MTRLPLVALITLTLAAPLSAQSLHDKMHARMHGTDGTLMHDEATMPGLIGENTTAEEVADLAELFRNHAGLERHVETLANGIRATTTATDERLREALVNHVAAMIARVEAQDDPRIPIQSPTLDLLFDKPDLIVTEIEITETGVVVTQTSDDPAIVAALQTHAAEVSDMALRGMLPIHERMMGGN